MKKQMEGITRAERNSYIKAATTDVAILDIKEKNVDRLGEALLLSARSWKYAASVAQHAKSSLSLVYQRKAVNRYMLLIAQEIVDGKHFKILDFRGIEMVRMYFNEAAQCKGEDPKRIILISKEFESHASSRNLRSDETVEEKKQQALPYGLGMFIAVSSLIKPDSDQAILHSAQLLGISLSHAQDTSHPLHM